MLCQLKNIYQLSKGHDKMAVPAVEEFLHVSSYPLLESMGFYTDISDGAAKNEGRHYFGRDFPPPSTH